MTSAWLSRSTPPSDPPTRKNNVEVEHVAQHQRLRPVAHGGDAQLGLARPAQVAGRGSDDAHGTTSKLVTIV